MEISIIRTYYKNGTNGRLFINTSPHAFCSTIELPWLDNKKGASCIPEGRYKLRLRYSQQFRTHLEVMDVPKRSLILVHPANDALKELRGCIAPVTTLTGEGKGSSSRAAFNRLCTVVALAIRQESIYITFKS